MTDISAGFPYYNRYNEDKEFYQILFNPGVALQASELTELQSILQNQIEKFGKNIFKEGSMVLPGATALNVQYPFLKIQPTYNSLPINLANFTGKTIVGLTSGTIATVLNTVATDGVDPNTLYIKFESGTSAQTFTASITTGVNIVSSTSIVSNQFVVGGLISGTGIPANTFITAILSANSVQISNPATATNLTASLSVTTADVFANGETIQTVETGATFSANLAASSATGLGSNAQIQRGVYFVQGYFILVQDQLLILDKYTNTPSYQIGLTVSTTDVSASDDITLNDPAAGFFNFNAPGADRRKIELILTKLPLNTPANSSFVKLLTVKDGVIQTQVTRPQYSELEKTLARRTNDQSGDFTVKYFPLEIKEHLNNGTNGGVYSASNGGLESNIVYAVEPGKAYVRGFEIELQETLLLPAPKARDSKVFNNYTTNVDFGNSIDVTLLTHAFDISGYDSVNLYSATGGGGTLIGTANVRGITFISGTPGSGTEIYRVNLFNIVMGGSYLFKDVKSVVSVAGATANVVLVSSQAVLTNVDASIGIVQIPAIATKTLKPSGVGITNYQVRRLFSSTMVGNTATLTAGTNEIFEAGNNFNYIVAIDTASATALGNGYINGEIINMTAGHTFTLAGSPTGKQIVLTMADIAGSTLKIIATVNKTLTTQKSKTLTSRTQSLSHASTITLDKADISNIVSIIDDSTSANITSQYNLDNGQRDNFYDVGRLNFISTYTAPATTVTITYNYFAHGAGDYFSVDSYIAAGVNYGDIPVFVSNTSGQLYDLINAIDFRPRIADGGSGYSVYSEFVAPAHDIAFNFEYYLSRIDKIFLDQNGNFKIINGKSSDNPVSPNEPNNGIVLYTVNVPPYTFKTKSVTAKLVDNRRYTMRDIGNLSERISSLEYYTSLSLLETNTSTLFINDGTGNNAFKNGFIVDNFQSHLVGDIALTSYECSMDTTNGILRPQFFSQNVGLVLDATNSPSTWTLTSGGLITLPFTEISFIKQSLASGTENLNPYDIYSWVGSLALTPSSDDWYETKLLPDIVVQSSDASANTLANLNGQVIWNDWQTTWTGTPSAGAPAGTINVSSSDNLGYTNIAVINAELARAPSQYQAFLRNFNPTSASVIIKNGVRTYVVDGVERGTSSGSQTRSGIQTTAVPTTTTQVIDTKTIDTSTIPYMRSTIIQFSATKLRPNDRVYPFFDNVNVSAYTKPTGGNNGDALVTDANGAVSGTFTIPDPISSGKTFRTGSRLFKLIDDVNNNSDMATTSASTLFSASGIIQTQQRDVLSTQTTQLVQNTVSETRSLVGTNNQTVQFSLPITWKDPLAETFLINVEGGVFVSKINLYFSSKDDSIPVSLQLRNVINGYPGPDIIPFGDVTLNPSQVNVSTDGSVATTFNFSSPVYLQNGKEYCFVAMANSGQYNVYIAKQGQLDILTNSFISKQPYAGVMFKSQNASTWTAAQDEDIKFEIFRCSFDTVTPANILFRNEDISTDALAIDPLSTLNASKVVTIFHVNHGLATGQKTTIANVVGTKNNIPAAELNGQHVVTVIDFDHYTITVSTTNANKTGSTGGSGITATKNYQMDVTNLNMQNLNFPSTELDFAIKTTDIAGNLDTTFSNVSLNTNLALITPKSILSVDNENVGKSLLVDATMTTTVENLSPVIDTARCSSIIVGNRINNDSTNETLAQSGNAIARYITKQVTLATQANSINVQFAAVRPANATIQVYIKMLPSDSEVTFDSQPYVLVPATDYPVYSSNTFSDYTFELDAQPAFTIFAIKIVMLAIDTASAPQIKNFRSIAITK